MKDVFELSFNKDEIFASCDEAVQIVVGVWVQQAGRATGTHPQLRLRQPRAEAASQTPW